MMTPEFITDVSTAWQTASTHQIELTPEQMDAAIAYSDQLATDLRWSAYLDYLAYLGLQQWLDDRGLGEVSLGTAYPMMPLQLQLGEFKLSILTVGGLLEDSLSLPQNVLEQAEFASHFYVWVQVLEEEQTIAIKGWLTYPQLQQACVAESGEAYSLSISAFSLEPNQLLLQLRCLDESAIALPSVTTAARALPNFSLPKIDVGQWLNQQIDQLAQEVGWLLMPSLAMPVMRTMQGNFEAIRSSLQQQGVQIPEQAKGAYRDLTWQDADSNISQTIRLYAVMWLLDPTAPASSDWILLTVVDAPTDQSTPVDRIQLVVRDADQTLFDQTKTASQTPAILYAQVMGQQHESFWVDITVNQTQVFEIPPFGFASDI